MSSQDKKVVIFIDPEKKSEGAYQELFYTIRKRKFTFQLKLV